MPSRVGCLSRWQPAHGMQLAMAAPARMPTQTERRRCLPRARIADTGVCLSRPSASPACPHRQPATPGRWSRRRSLVSGHASVADGVRSLVLISKQRRLVMLSRPCCAVAPAHLDRAPACHAPLAGALLSLLLTEIGRCRGLPQSGAACCLVPAASAQHAHAARRRFAATRSGRF